MINLGFAILQRWIVVLDYANYSIQLRQGGDASGNVVHDHYGMTIGARGTAIVVLDVLGGMPAARANIGHGLTLQSIDGRAVSLKRVREDF
jgi:S1-C subfamily serine protease